MRFGHTASRGRPAQPVGPAVDICLVAVPTASAAARGVIVDALQGHVDEQVLADARLLVSELVTCGARSSGLAADGFVRVGAVLTRGVLRLEVEDSRDTSGNGAGHPDLEQDGGFGLRLVDALSHSWGISRDGHTRVWVELLVSPTTPADVSVSCASPAPIGAQP
jgi:anti-sigma regulatory factor (Ser/Thr protein kinase)